MIPTTPRIGFDRFINLAWATTALKVRAGIVGLDELDAVLDAAGLGKAARKKTYTVLNRLWLEPRPELADFADRGANLFRLRPDISASVLSWGMSIAAYSFFGKVAELVGRLAALQGDCASTEVHRRMSEIYGEREGTYRMTNMVLQSQVNWGAIERVESGKRLVRRSIATVDSDHVAEWLVEAVLRYSGKPVTVATIQSNPVIFPILLDQPLAYIASKSTVLELRSDAQSSPSIALRTES